MLLIIELSSVSSISLVLIFKVANRPLCLLADSAFPQTVYSTWLGLDELTDISVKFSRFFWLSSWIA